MKKKKGKRRDKQYRVDKYNIVLIYENNGNNMQYKGTINK